MLNIYTTEVCSFINVWLLYRPYITMDFATVASQNCVYKNQHMCHDLVPHLLYEKDESVNKKIIVFCHTQNNVVLL
jgi:hypothetical protein